MPTKHYKRRGLRTPVDAGPIERWVNCQINDAELSELLGNAFIRFGPSWSDYVAGPEARRIWERDGATLLKKFNYHSPIEKSCIKGTNIIEPSEYPGAIVSCLDSFGLPAGYA